MSRGDSLKRVQGSWNKRTKSKLLKDGPAEGIATEICIHCKMAKDKHAEGFSGRLYCKGERTQFVPAEPASPVVPEKDPETHTTTVEWDAEDEIFIARVVEHPECTGHGATEIEAINMADENLYELRQEAQQPTPVVVLNVDLKDWLDQAVDLLNLYHSGYCPKDVAATFLEKCQANWKNVTAYDAPVVVSAEDDEEQAKRNIEEEYGCDWQTLADSLTNPMVATDVLMDLASTEVECIRLKRLLSTHPAPLPSDDAPEPSMSDDKLSEILIASEGWYTQTEKKMATELQQWRKWAAALPVGEKETKICGATRNEFTCSLEIDHDGVYHEHHEDGMGGVRWHGDDRPDDTICTGNWSCLVCSFKLQCQK